MNKLKINTFLFRDLLRILLFIFSFDEYLDTLMGRFPFSLSNRLNFINFIIKIKKDYQYLISILEHLDTEEEKI